MSQVLDKLQRASLRNEVPEFNPGDTVRVHVRLREGDGEGEKEKERIQPFEGVVIGRHGRLASQSFTVRRVSYGIGIERIFPVHSPVISRIEVVRRGRVRRAKLYYLRGLKGKAARIKQAERRTTQTTASSAQE
jgi:large subunit ribosomal protein L19